VCRWKTPRSGPLVATNSAAEVETATRTALGTASMERERTDALRSLAGVDFPTASVLLHLAYPERYPILDKRALHALGVRAPAICGFRLRTEYAEEYRGFGRGGWCGRSHAGPRALGVVQRAGPGVVLPPVVDGTLSRRVRAPQLSCRRRSLTASHIPPEELIMSAASPSAPIVTGVDFVTVPAQDLEDSVHFYGTVLGLPFVKRWGEMPAAEFQAGNLTIAVMDPTAFGQEFRPHAVPVAFQVDDVAAARAQLEAQGVRFVTDMIDSGVCHQAIFLDPAGNALGLHHRYAANPD
jgi:predicted enzyme related to lactoylglutathione lyase